MQNSTQNMAAISVYSHTKQETAKLSCEIKIKEIIEHTTFPVKYVQHQWKYLCKKREGFPWNNWYFFWICSVYCILLVDNKTNKRPKDQKQQIQSISFYIFMLYCAYAPLVHVQCIKYDLCFSCLLVRSISGCGFMYIQYTFVMRRKQKIGHTDEQLWLRDK